MRPINRKKSKVFSFLLGLVYGYRTADMELKVLPLSDFDADNHDGANIYFLDKKRDLVSKNEPIEDPSHVVVILEDLEERKVRIYIYRS